MYLCMHINFEYYNMSSQHVKCVMGFYSNTYIAKYSLPKSDRPFSKVGFGCTISTNDQFNIVRA